MRSVRVLASDSPAAISPEAWPRLDPKSSHLAFQRWQRASVRRPETPRIGRLAALRWLLSSWDRLHRRRAAGSFAHSQSDRGRSARVKGGRVGTGEYPQMYLEADAYPSPSEVRSQPRIATVRSELTTCPASTGT